MKFWLIVFGILVVSVSNGQQDDKMNGVALVAAPRGLVQENVDSLAMINANYVAVIPFGFISDLKSPKVEYNHKRQWFGETVEGVKQQVGMLKDAGYDIMIKPQIWAWDGSYTGHIKCENNSDWNKLENSYAEFILCYAALADSLDVPVFCIGTELGSFVDMRRSYWLKLIQEIKKVYSGKLTYASNWDDCRDVYFWQELDFIGVDAYFPLSNSKTPEKQELINGWKSHKALLSNLSKINHRKVLFTEYGYRSIDYTGKEPWQSNYEQSAPNFDAQYNAYEALFEVFWSENWFAGGFIWKWFPDDAKTGGKTCNRFTPQNKPVEDLISRHYLTK